MILQVKHAMYSILCQNINTSLFQSGLIRKVCSYFFILLSFQRHIKYVRNLISVTAYGDHCVLATRADETTGQVVGSVSSMPIGQTLSSMDMEFELVGLWVAG